MKILMITVLLVVAAAAGFPLPAQQENASNPEYEIVKQVITDSLGWAKTKDYNRLESIWADDETIFSHFLFSRNTIIGKKAFMNNAEKFRSPDFKATRTEYRDFRIIFSKSGDVAWFSCNFDDCGEYKGQEFCVENALKTGVLEKRTGKWVLVQVHSSYPADKIPESLIRHFYGHLFESEKKQP